MGAHRAACVAMLATLAFAQTFSQSTRGEEEGGKSPARAHLFVMYPDHHDRSRPLREMVLEPELRAPHREGARDEVQSIPLRRAKPPLISLEPDTVLQRAAAKPSPNATVVTQFEGMCNQDGVIPPDANAAVGSTQIVEVVNNWLGIYSKDGDLLILNGLGRVFNNFGGPCDPQDPAFIFGRRWADPVILYDEQANRWVISFIAIVDGAFTSDGTPTFTICQGVSTSHDATGSWTRMAINSSPQIINGVKYAVLPDYPKLGVWPDAYYATYNMFRLSPQGVETYFGARVCAFNRSALLSGGVPPAVCFQLDPTHDSLLPADLDGATAPAAGTPNFLLELGTTTTLRMFRFHVDFGTPSNSTLSGPVSVSVASYTEACAAGACIPQRGTTRTLDAIGDRLMHRLAYRNRGTHESLVANHSVAVGARVGVRWYEIRNPTGTPTVHQSGTYAPNDTNSRWMGSIAMDASGNIALGYSVSGSNLYPSIRFSARAAGDPLGQLQAETTIIDGQNSQFGFVCGSSPDCAKRWGDYTSMAVDPSDDATFVYTNEYYAAPGTGCPRLGGENTVAAWRTRIGKFAVTTAQSGGGGKPK